MAVPQKIVIGFLAALFVVTAQPAAAADMEDLSLNPIPYKNENEDFLRWLNGKDAYAGVARGQLLTEAYRVLAG